MIKCFNKKNFLIVGLVLLLVVPLLFCLTGCNKKPVTLDEFKSKAEEQGWKVGKDSRSNSYSNYIALKNGAQVEFYDCESTENAKAAFDSDYKSFESKAKYANVDKSVELSSTDYHFYNKVFNGDMHMIIQCGQTYVFCDSSSDVSGIVEELINAIGY